MTVRFVQTAEAELDEAILYYEGEYPSLGAEFLTEVTAAVNRIVEFPHAWQELETGIRRCRLHRFPYGIVYALSKNNVVVLGVAHLHREHQVWRARLNRDR